MKIKNINLGKSKISLISIFFYLLTISTVQADDLDYFGKKIDIRILDKLSSKSKLLKLDIGENFSYKNLEIKVLKCKNSKFDDNPEITTYLQVKDWIKWEKKFVYGPYVHHVVGIYGDHRKAFSDACKYLDIKYDNPD
mgnify:CR=1 FL=1